MITLKVIKLRFAELLLPTIYLLSLTVIFRPFFSPPQPNIIFLICNLPALIILLQSKARSQFMISISVLCMIVILFSHLFFVGIQFGDSSYYVDWVENDRKSNQGGFVPSLLISAPLSSLVIQTLIRFIPFISLYIAPILFLALILITFLIYKNRGFTTFRYRNFIHFYFAIPFSIFMFSKYIEYYVVSFFIILLIGILLKNYKLNPLSQSILIGFASISHLLFLPLLLLNFLLLKEVPFRLRFLYSIVGFISSVSFVLIFGKLAGLDFIKGNLPLEDSFVLDLTTDRFMSALAAFFIYLIFYFIFFSRGANSTYSFVVYTFGCIYLFFAFFWNLKLGLFADSDLLISPTIVFAFLVLLFNHIESYSPKHINQLQSLSIVNCLVTSCLLSI